MKKYEGRERAAIPVVEEEQTHCQACQGATEMAHKTRSVVGVVEPHVDSEPHVMNCQQEDERGPYDHRYGLLDNLRISTHTKILCFTKLPFLS